MKSSIKIDFADNGKGLQPFIKIVLSSTDDPRDKLLSTFFQSLGGESNWLSVRFEGHTGGNNCTLTSYISIFPITPDELKETSDIILNRIEGSGQNSYPANNNTLITGTEQAVALQ